MPGLRGGAPEQAEEEEEDTYLKGAEQEDFQENINSLSENATAIMEHLYDVFYGRTCGGILTESSGSDPNHIVTLIAPVAGYLMMLQDFLNVKRKSGWWVTDPHLLAIATNMKRIENLYAKHLDKGCEKERPGADMLLIPFCAELEKLPVEDLKEQETKNNLPDGMVVLTQEELAAIKKRVDNRKICDKEQLVAFHKLLDEMIFQRKKRGVGHNFFCRVGDCLLSKGTRQKMREHIEVKHVDRVKHLCEYCHTPQKTSASLSQHLRKIHG
jgi:hypothetical protein